MEGLLVDGTPGAYVISRNVKAVVRWYRLKRSLALSRSDRFSATRNGQNPRRVDVAQPAFLALSLHVHVQIGYFEFMGINWDVPLLCELLQLAHLIEVPVCHDTRSWLRILAEAFARRAFD